MREMTIRKRNAAAQVLLFLITTAAFCQRPATRSGPAPELPVCQSILTPSYFHPRPSGSEWDTLIADAPTPGKASRILIVNPNSGPGASANADFRSMVEKVHRTGQKVYGYVPTGYGARPMSSVQKQVAEYVSWYGVDGIFVDEVSEKAALVKPYYQPLATFITSQIKGGGVMLNHGTYPDASYADIKVPETSSLQLVVFEHDYHAFTAPSFHVPSWTHEHPARMFVGIVYATSQRHLPAALRLLAERNIGSVYVTDKDLPNPYSALPSYWQALVHDAQAGCGH
jgi:hypothetical protein